MLRKPTNLTRREGGNRRGPTSHADMLARFHQAHAGITADNQRYRQEKQTLNAPPTEEPEGTDDEQA
jgi:hypothetical protein